MPAAIPFIAGAAASSAAVSAGWVVAGSIGAALIGGAASAASGMLLSALTAPSAPDISGANFAAAGAGRTQAVRQPITAHRIIYGTAKVSGPIVFAHTAADDAAVANGYLYLIHVLAAHECEAIGDIYIGDTLSTDAKFTGLARVTGHLGPAAQTVDTDWLAEIPAVWGVNHRLRGRAYLASRLKFDVTAFSSGVPNISTIVTGANDIYDPRDGSTGWSENAALCVAHYLTSERGLGIGWANIDNDTLIASANVCDEQVAIAAGGTLARYTCNGVVSLDTAPRDVIQQLLTAMAGTIVTIGGKWYIHAGSVTLGHIDLNEDDLRGDMTTVPKRPMRDRMNGVRATYIDPDQNWQPVDAPPRMDATYLAQDNSVELTRDLKFPFTTNLPTVQRLMKIELERNRRERVVMFPAKLTAMQLRPLSGVALTIDRYGWDREGMRVIGWTLAEDGGIDLTLQVDDDYIWSWGIDDEQTGAAAQSIAVGNPRVQLNGNSEFLLNSADSSLPNARTITAGTGITITDGGAGADLTIAPTSGGISDTMLRDSAGVSVIGRSANSSGSPADIAAGSDGHVLRRSPGVLSFGLIDLTASVTGLLPLANGGTNANLTASTGGVLYSGASALAILAGTVTANKPLMSGASAAPSWSTPTYPNASATAGKIIRSDGTNYAASTLTVPDTITVNQIPYASGTNALGSSSALTFDGTNLACGGSVAERARTAAMGEWTTPTYAAGNFTGSASMTWGVDSGDVLAYEYALVGKTIHVNYYLVTTTVGGTPDAYLKLNLFGFTVAKNVNNRSGVYQGAWVNGVVEGRAGESFLRLYADTTEASNWAASTDGTYVKGTITLEIQ